MIRKSIATATVSEAVSGLDPSFPNETPRSHGVNELDLTLNEIVNLKALSSMNCKEAESYPFWCIKSERATAKQFAEGPERLRPRLEFGTANTAQASIRISSLLISCFQPCVHTKTVPSQLPNPAFTSFQVSPLSPKCKARSEAVLKLGN